MLKKNNLAPLLPIIGILILLFVNSFCPVSITANSITTHQNKISSLLSMHVRLKQIQTSTSTQSTMPLYGMEQNTTAGTTLINSEKIFIYLAKQPTPAQISELNSLSVSIYPDSWVPSVDNFKNGFVMAEIPVDKLDLLTTKSYIVALDTAEQELFFQNDKARAAIFADPVWTGGNTGSGVTVAVIDSGLDTSNKDFPTPVAAIDYSNYPSKDFTVSNTATGHGTHVTGSLLGQGQNSAAYQGVAPGAGLVFIKVGDSEGSVSTQAAVYAIRDAVDIYHAKIVNLSLGWWSEYHDGSDQLCQAVDYATSRGTTVFVAAGNYASSEWHYSGTIASGNTSTYIPINVSKGSKTTLPLNLVWFDGLSTQNNLTLTYYDSKGKLLPCISGGQSESERGTESNLLQLKSQKGAGNYYLRVTNHSASNQFFHIYYIGGLTSVNFPGANQDYTICSPAEADSAVAIGAYVSRSNWTNYQGKAYWYGLSENNIASFTSHGPRVDTGAPDKPDLLAPGSAIISVRDPICTPGNSNYDPAIIDNDGSNLNGSGPADYLVMSGTSMAAPMAAGVAALLLSQYPDLVPAQVKYALESTASRWTLGHDNAWGYGLINARYALQVNLDLKSYSDSVHTVPCNDFQSYFSQHTLYLFSTGLLPNENYKITYYDGENKQVASHIVTTGYQSFSDQHSFLSGFDTAGVWHVIVTEPSYHAPITFNGACPYAILSATFNVQDSAIASVGPRVLTEAASNITLTGAVLNASLASTGNAVTVYQGFEYGFSTGYGTIVEGDPSTAVEPGVFSASVSGLVSDKTYHFRARAVSDTGQVYTGQDVIFYTGKLALPEQIVFSSQYEGPFHQIYIMNADGSQPKKLTSSTIDCRQPDISHDGSKIAYYSDGHIFVINIDGTGLTQLTNIHAAEPDPAWSPEDTKIAFTSYLENDPQIWVMAADGSNQSRLTSSGQNVNPDWSPDGKEIVFSSFIDGFWQICKMNSDGSNLVRLTSDNSTSDEPAWSPDGKRIVFTRAGHEIWVMDVDGSNSARLSENYTWRPCWSPDGSKIAFVSIINQPPGIYVMKSDGSNVMRLSTLGNDYDPTWGGGGFDTLVSTTVNLVSSAFESTLGQAVTFYSTVSATGPSTEIPDGTVTFLEAGRVLGTGTLNAAHSATCTIDTLSADLHYISTRYGGNNHLHSSDSPAIPLLVFQASTITSLVSSLNPATYGESVTFTATVSVVPPGSGTPAGMVYFKESDNILGMGRLNTDGQSTLQLNNMAVGTHPITTEYFGDVNYSGSISTEIIQVISPILPPEITLSGILHEGEVKNTYPAQTLTVSRGSAPYKWQWSALPGSSLPPGLKLTDGTDTLSAIIAGRPSKAGTFDFTVTVTDINMLVGTKSLSININPSVSMTLPKVLPGDIGVPYSLVPSARGGTGNLSWKITSSEKLPPGLDLNASTGEISGIPTTPGKYKFTLAVEDIHKNIAGKSVTIKINKDLIVTTDAIKEAKIGKTYVMTIKATGGQVKYSWYLADGSDAFPPWVDQDKFKTRGTLTPKKGQKPDVVGSYNLIFKVVDSLGDSAVSLPIILSVKEK
jgi:subtilisin family serine protease